MVPEEAIGSRPARRAALLVLLSLLAAGCVSHPAPPPVPPGYREFRVPAVDELLFGTWAAPAGSSGQPARLRILAWGLVEAFASAQDGEPRWTGTSLVVDAWADEEGARWYREYRRWSKDAPGGGGAFVLDRVSADGLSLQTVSSAAGWPDMSELSPAHAGFAQYMRVGASP